jgi:hypothetical protein
LIAEWRTGEVPMNKKAKTKAQKADEDANLDEALDESFPASDPPSITQPRTGADVRQRKPKRHPKGEGIHHGTGGAARVQRNASLHGLVNLVRGSACNQCSDLALPKPPSRTI